MKQCSGKAERISLSQLGQRIIPCRVSDQADVGASQKASPNLAMARHSPWLHECLQRFDEMGLTQYQVESIGFSIATVLSSIKSPCFIFF